MKGENIATRLLVFGAGVIRLCRRLPDDASAKHIARQLVRAATGGGANYEEARGAESRADFIHKVGIANKELREALYWVRLIDEAALVTDSELAALIREANELVAILTASIRTAKQRDVTSCAEAQSWRTREGGEPGSWYLSAGAQGDTRFPTESCGLESAAVRASAPSGSVEAAP